MKYLILILLIACSLQAKIYDCFIFYNELELLQIRLHELYEHVDKFVLVEAASTFRGNSKPLIFEEHKQNFAPYLDKIIHIIIKAFPPANSAWDRESFQRNQIMGGLTNCNDDDLILISDSDEIVRPCSIGQIIQLLETVTKTNVPMVLCNQTMYRYFFNRFDLETPWPGTVALYYKDLKRLSPQHCRNLAQHRIPEKIENAGWHFTSMGGHERFIDKLASFSHAEYDTQANREFQTFVKKVQQLPVHEIDETYPKLIYANVAQYIQKGFIDTIFI